MGGKFVNRHLKQLKIKNSTESSWGAYTFVLALLICAEVNVSRRYSKKRIHISSENQAALQISNPNLITSWLILECTIYLKKLVGSRLWGCPGFQVMGEFGVTLWQKEETFHVVITQPQPNYLFKTGSLTNSLAIGEESPVSDNQRNTQDIQVISLASSRPLRSWKIPSIRGCTIGL